MELATEEAAITMVNYYSAVTPHLRNQPIYIQYSNHKELKTDNTLNQVYLLLHGFRNVDSRVCDIYTTSIMNTCYLNLLLSTFKHYCSFTSGFGSEDLLSL